MALAPDALQGIGWKRFTLYQAAEWFSHLQMAQPRGPTKLGVSRTAKAYTQGTGHATLVHGLGPPTHGQAGGEDSTGGPDPETTCGEPPLSARGQGRADIGRVKHSQSHARCNGHGPEDLAAASNI